MSLVALLALAGYFVLLFLLSQGACSPREIKQVLLRWREEAIVSLRAYFALKKQTGFTLIELSIVLVIIGLIVGGVLVGQDLIRVAGVRATISQIEKYNTAANTFRGKYGALPGDMNAATAAQFGFLTRAGTQARGDGNGLIEGFDYANNVTINAGIGAGEPLFFWEDLSSANLIEGGFNTATDAAFPVTVTSTSTPSLSALLPSAKLGGGNSVSVYSYNGVNYFGLYPVPQIAVWDDEIDPTMGLTVAQAYALDSKIDDGLPTSGNVQANHASEANPPFRFPATNAGSPSPSTCYDTTSNQYSMSENGGAGVNCTLSFKMQAGD